MRLLVSAIIYTALAAGANAADIDALSALRDGDMKKLNFAASPAPVSQRVFADAAGNEHTLAEYQGKHVLLNFWATWCAPCRKEMPSLDALNGEFGGDTFAVVTVATGRNALPAIKQFFADEEIATLPILLDPRQKLARDMAVLGLPISVLLNPDGEEIARLRGDADWSSDSARAIVAALIGPDRR